MDPLLLRSLATGAAFAGGVLLVVRELVPAPPALGGALHRLHPHAPALAAPPRWRRRHLPAPVRSLALLGREPRDYHVALAAGAAAGVAVPVLLAGMALVAGRADLSAPVAAGGLVASLVCAAAGALVVHWEVTARAARVRAQFRPVVATYLGLVAMQRAAGHGSVESLERAAQVGDSLPVRRIRDALQRARTYHRPPWDELQQVAAQLGVPELADVGQIMHGSGIGGAAVHRTLLQRAASLREQIRTEALARAERVNVQLEAPGVLLLMLLVAYFLYPVTRQLSL